MEFEILLFYKYIKIEDPKVSLTSKGIFALRMIFLVELLSHMKELTGRSQEKRGLRFTEIKLSRI